MELFSDNGKDLQTSTSQSNNIQNAVDGIPANYDPTKLKLGMMTLSGHSCVKSPANLAPLPINSKESQSFKTQQDAEYFATDDFLEFEGDEDNAIIHTPPAHNNEAQHHIYQQAAYHHNNDNNNINQYHNQQQHHQHQHHHQQQQQQHNHHQHPQHQQQHQHHQHHQHPTYEQQTRHQYNNNHNNNNRHHHHHQNQFYHHNNNNNNQHHHANHHHNNNNNNNNNNIYAVYPNTNANTNTNQHMFYTNKYNGYEAYNQQAMRMSIEQYNYLKQKQKQMQIETEREKEREREKKREKEREKEKEREREKEKARKEKEAKYEKEKEEIIKQTLLEAQSVQNDRVKRGETHFPSSDLCGRYEFVRYLGHGSYGHVCEALSLSTQHKHERVAIKKVPHVFRNLTDAKRLLRELVILRTVKEHEAIITLIDILPPTNIDDFNTLYLVFEFVDTDLAQLINSPQHFERLHSQYIIYQILLGLQYLHSANIVHRDLKPANILVNENVSTKICDFGLARGITENLRNSTPKSRAHKKIKIKKVFKDVHETEKQKAKHKHIHRQLTKHVVTRWYRAPEVILFSQRREYLTAIDMWSVGCILSELLMMVTDNDDDENTTNFKHRQPLFPGRSCFPLSARDPEAYKDNLDQLNCIFSVIGTPTDEEIEKIKDEQARAYLQKLAKNSFQKPMDLSTKFQNASKQELDLLRRLLQFDVEKRITVDQALSHPYLEDVRDLQAELRHKKVVFSFEDVMLDIKTIYELIVDEICNYNLDLLK